MKKILSILLALCMVVGIGLCGTVSASAGLGDLITGGIIVGSLLEKMPSLAQLLAYESVCIQESLRPEVEAGLLPGKKLDDVAAAVESVMAGLDFNNFLLDVPKPELEQMLALCDEIFTANFNSDFIAAFNKLRDTGAQAIDLYFRAIVKLGPMLQGGALLLRPSLMFEVLELMGDTQMIDMPEDLSTLAEMAAYYEGIIERINTTMAKVDARNAEKWWENLPDWLQWILRTFLFGWIWMR